MYGYSFDSWCPSCHTAGQVMTMVGQIPSPQLYGVWVETQQRHERDQHARAELQALVKRHLKQEEPTMKRPKTHSGTYHCPSCFIELELYAEESLKCDHCKGPLVPGPLDQIWAEDGEDNEE